MGPLEGRAQALGARRGFTLVELAVIICLVALLFGIALDRLLRTQELGEQAAMEQNLAAINTALTMRFATLVIAGRGRDIEKEAGANPIPLLARPPENYLGALYAPAPGSLESRSWYFDRASGDLVYLPGRKRYLTEPPDAEKGLHFRVELSDSASADLRQPFIRPRKPYRWIID
ncbi:MAG: type II secretion system protein [Betaproteobacteria bacterium]|nr:MAG: type II secretion system protein [Betaproteobacteria bacterium]